MNNKIVVCVSGYYDPLHCGHLEYLLKAKELGDELVVIVNNDQQACLKKGQAFMPCQERCEIIRHLSGVDRVVASIDQDRTVCRTLEKIRPDIFCNGGDQSNEQIPEGPICQKLGIKMVDGLGDKIQSSSWLISKAKKIKTKKIKTIEKSHTKNNLIRSEVRHDLKIFLHGISGYAELLAYGHEEDTEIQKYYQEIDQIIQSGLKYIDQKLCD